MTMSKSKDQLEREERDRETNRKAQETRDKRSAESKKEAEDKAAENPPAVSMSAAANPDAAERVSAAEARERMAERGEDAAFQQYPEELPRDSVNEVIRLIRTGQEGNDPAAVAYHLNNFIQWGIGRAFGTPTEFFVPPAGPSTMGNLIAARGPVAGSVPLTQQTVAQGVDAEQARLMTELRMALTDAQNRRSTARAGQISITGQGVGGNSVSPNLSNDLIDKLAELAKLLLGFFRADPIPAQ